MSDAEMQRLAAMIAEQVCQRAILWIETICVRTFVVLTAFWIARIAFLFWQAFRKKMQK